ncbi:MAG: hypothetical protein AB7U20_02775 [Planctomycetaceae bacterium]
MQRRSITVGFAMAVLAVLGLATSASAGKQVPFKGSLEGSFDVSVDPGPPPVGTFDGSGEGHATHLGHFTYEFPHMVNFGSVPPMGIGVYTFTAANGDTLEAEFTGFSTPVEPGVVFVVEEAVITGGTGRFTGASGEFTVERLVDQIGRTTIGSFDGTISSVGASKH